MAGVGSRAVPAQFVGCALAWGASFLFMKVALEGLTPPQVVLGRLVAGAAALCAVSLVTQTRPHGWGRVWGHFAVIAVLLCVVPFFLYAWAETRVSSGLASIYNATTPLMTLLVAVAALPEERPTRGRLAGLAMGFAGVAIVLGPWRGLGGGEAVAQLACVGAPFCYGLGFVYLRRYVAPLGLPALTVATGQIGVAALMMLVATPFVATTPPVLTWRVVGSIAVLGVIGTGLAYVWNTNVVGAWGATRASTVTYLTPVVGVALGVLLLGESVSWNEPVGALVVILGILIGQGRLRGPGRLT